METAPQKRTWDSALHSACENTKAWITGSIVAYLLNTVITLGAAVLIALFTPAKASLLTQAVYGLIGGLGALVLFLIFIFLLHWLSITPYRQRNKARELVEDQEKQLAEIKRDYDKQIDEIKINDPFVLEAQGRHFEEQAKEDFINLSRCFDIQPDPRYRISYYQENPQIDEAMLRGHFPKDHFWQTVDWYKDMDVKVHDLLKELDKEIQGKAETEVAPLDPYLHGDVRVPCITPYFVMSVVELAVNSYLGISADYLKYEWNFDVDAQVWAANFTSYHVESELKHREYVDSYAKDKRCETLANMIKQLREGRDSILDSIGYCVKNQVYILEYCYCCPKRLASHK